MTTQRYEEGGVVIAMALLRADAGVAELTGAGDRLYPDDVPQGVALPAVSVRSISRVRRTPMSLVTDACTVTERVQITPQCSVDTPTELGRLIRAIDLACRPQRREACAGFDRVVIEDEGRGPTITDPEQRVRQRAMDYRITYQEPTGT